MMKAILFLIGATLSIAACRDDEPLCVTEEQPVIRFGSRSVWCYPCASMTEFDPQQIRFTQQSRNGADSLLCQTTMPDSTWLALIGAISLNEFNDLPESIGCPGCADGPVEWIEIETITSSHRVTFDPFELPPTLSNLYAAIEQVDSAWCRR